MTMPGTYFTYFIHVTLKLIQSFSFYFTPYSDFSLVNVPGIFQSDMETVENCCIKICLLRTSFEKPNTDTYW